MLPAYDYFNFPLPFLWWSPHSLMHCTSSSYYSWLFCRFFCENPEKVVWVVTVLRDSVASRSILLETEVGTYITRAASHLMTFESEFSKHQAKQHELPFLFLYSSSLFLIPEKFLMLCSFPSNYLWFISRSYFTKTWKHTELTSFIAMVIPSREFESTEFVLEEHSEWEELSALLVKILKLRDNLWLRILVFMYSSIHHILGCLLGLA